MRRIRAEQHLPEFIKQGWRHVEPNAYGSNWHTDAISDHLTGIVDRQIKRLIINIPPRHMKTLQTGVFMPAWVWAQDPDPTGSGHGKPIRPGTWRGPGVKFIFSSYEHGLAIESNVKARRLMDSDWYRDNWGERVNFAKDQNTKIYYENTRNGARFATSSSGVLTGKGADIFVIDDPHNVQQAESETVREGVLKWWQESVPTRLNDPEAGAFIIVMQRVHEGDLTGHILAKETGWTHLCLPAYYEPKHPTPIANPVRKLYGPQAGQLWEDPRTQEGEPLWKARFTKQTLDEWSSRMGSYATAGQLQQRPAPREGGFFKRHWFSIVNALPAGCEFVRRWDLAATEAGQGSDPDWTVGVLMARDTFGFVYVADVTRLRGTPHDVERLIKNTAEQDGTKVRIRLPQDPGSAGKAYAQSLVRMLSGFDVKAEPETGDKATRANPFAAQAEAGNVTLVKAGWNEAYLDELTTFPMGRHDDQVDASSGAFNALAGPSKQFLFG
ncbi:hypothetical protein GCM10007036_14220 [Alsobacter metallidurans]|uniref:Terminase large subunit gp17-like C-terminal domain-containing protein n=2 Tax=Alsobacter metallidurans TaxID=340221 RepID=A0A917I674_9HYPH|nr:hypothetical protein GCM10007036_14220 [Alsobacter metallidurans]